MPSNCRTGWVLSGLTVLAWCAAPRTEAQPGPPPIRLSAGDLVVANGVDRALAAAAPVSLRTGPLHFIIQFASRPSNRDRDALATLGIRLLNPIPVNAYFAVATPPTAQPAALAPGGPLDRAPYRAVVLVPARYKITPLLEGALRGQPIPPHADRGNGRIAVTVRFHSDVPAQDRVTALRDLGVTIETPEPIRELQVGVDVAVPITDLLQLAEHDRIRSIDYIELEGEDDNDTVRSAEGADSDAVVTAYDVTGADVVIGQFEGGVAGSHKDLSRLNVADTGVTTQSVHATHVAGTLIGDGTLNGQWRGVATGARILAYDDKNRQSEYQDAIETQGLIATNTSWDSTYCHRISTAAECYDDHSQFYDTVVSGRTNLADPTDLPRRIIFVGSAGNLGAPERHADDVVPNGRYDPNETIYEDIDDDGKVGPRDRFKGIGTNYNASPLTDDVPLINFALNERHDDLHNHSMGYGSGAFESIDLGGIDEIVYRDLDDSEDVSVGDTRLSGPMAGSSVIAGDIDVNIRVGDVRLVTTAAGTAGSIVLAGDSDISIPERYLRQFRPWGSVRLQNSAKNTITVGSYLAGYGTLDPESGRGPTTDGRLKPDLVAPGSQYDGEGGVTSTVPIDAYDVDRGTSMAAPVVTGVAAMLIQWYRLACAEADPKPSTLRAVLLHSATDLLTIPTYDGAFVGPDYAYGYGAVNAPNAMAVMAHHREGVVTEADLGNPDAHTFEITVGATPYLKVTLAWDDVPWTAGDARDPTTGLLHNDLDLELVSPSGKIYTPWRLDPANPGVPAVASPGYGTGAVPVEARDRRNTVEQVVISNAVSGTWTIRVLASTLNHPDQDFSVVSDFLEPEEGAPCNATPATDVWVQDDPTASEDATPTATPWLSLDVWNGRAATPEVSSGLVNEDPAFDEDNNLYVRLRNRSTEEAKGSSIDVWAAPASTAPSWPNEFAYVGRLAAPRVPGRESRVFGPLKWRPRRQSPSNQLAYYVRVTNPRDPIPAAARSAAQSDNIALRNVHEIDLREGTQFIAFDLGMPRSTPDLQPRAVDLVISVTSRSRELPITARLLLDPDVEQRWIAAGAPSSGFTVPTNPAEPPALRSLTSRLRLTVNPRDRLERLVRAAISSSVPDRSPTVLDIVQCIDERVTGGIRYVLHTSTPRPLRGSELRPPAWTASRRCTPP